MKILLLKCLMGKKIGELELNHINKYGFFYYVFKQENDNCIDYNSLPIIIIQYKQDKTKNMPIGIGYGTVNSYVKIKEKSKSYIEIRNIKSFCLNNYLKKDLKKTQEASFNSLEKKVKEYIGEKNYALEKTSYELTMLDLSNNYLYDEIIRDITCFGDTNYAIEEDKDIQEVIKSYRNLERDLTTEEIGGCQLRPTAQKSIYAKRVINKGDIRKNRTEYQRDWERIIHSKAFRRLEDKAQIYTLSKGDHFRTRLTHTLEVTQIARGIARELRLNEDLVEAIALGHDLGHTPFGHVGERTLNQILENENVEGGFKHNFQGVKVVSYLEEKYGEFAGIDLTYQVMEGILKHTGICKCKEPCTNKTKGLDCPKNILQIDSFLCNGDRRMLNPKYDFATTLEGQVVAVADEIAQRAHDLDDGIASGIISEREFLNELGKDGLCKELYENIRKSISYIREDERDYIDILDIKRARIVSDVITYFIAKIVEDSQNEINKYEEKMKIPDYRDTNTLGELSKIESLVIEEKLIYFRGNTEKVRRRLEEISSNKIINSEEVNCFDGKGKYIIRKLYKAYKTNPMQMSKTTLKRIYREISKYMNDTIDLTDCNGDLEEQEINIYRMNIKETEFKNDIEEVKHKIFVRCVVDLIAGMTDDFANRQFAKLYSPRIY